MRFLIFVFFALSCLRGMNQPIPKANNLETADSLIQSQADAHYLSGENAIKKMEIDKALTHFEKSAKKYLQIELESEKVKVEQRIGEVCFNASYYSRAISSFKEVLTYRKLVADTVEIINNLIRISICYEEQGEYQLSLDYANEAYELAIKSNEFADAVRCLNIIAFVHRARGNSELALEFFEKGYDLAVIIGNTTFQATLTQNIGIVYSRSGEYVKSLQAYIKALKIFESNNDSLGISQVQFNIGLIYKKNGEYLKAIKYYNKSFQYDLKNADTSGIIYCHNNIGNAFLLLHEYDSAKYHLFQAYKLTNNVDIVCYDGEAAALGELYYEIGILDSAKFYLNKEYKSATECDNLMNLAKTTYLLGLVYRDLDNKSKAYEFFNSSFEVAQKTGYLEDIEKASQILYNWHKSTGNNLKALYYLEVYQQTNDLLFNQESTRKLTWIEANYKIDRKTDSLEMIKTEEARLLNFKIQKKNQQLNYIIIIAGISILILIMYFVYMRKRKQLKYQLAITKEQQKGLSAIIQAQEDERKRIAKDLHDGIVQQLGGLKLGLQKVFANKETDETNKIVEILDDSAQELRELSHKMMPRSLGELGLIPALTDMLENSLGNTDINYQFENFGIKDRFEENIEIAIYRIAQELINNVIKHSKADKVNVQLFNTASSIILIVEDNGKGIDKQGDRGIGLMNISSRLDTINGKVNFEPSPESGTLATIKIPIQQ